MPMLCMAQPASMNTIRMDDIVVSATKTEKRIEVIRGAGSAAYGGNAMASGRDEYD
jgi:outer membrane cobalamin receptor